MARKSRKHQSDAERLETKSPVFATYGYARISNDGERAGDSIENQIALITEYVSKQPDMELRGVITD
jgi:predicted site-specific integrase-resolvase